MRLKLCYVWVSEFRNFKNAGFNFSSSEKFHYDYFTGKLRLERIEELPKDFFGKSITEVTGLIGRNGSGKSNALELVCKLLKGGKTSVTRDFLIITKEDNQFVCYRSTERLSVKNSDFTLLFKEYYRNIDPLKIIYFTNVFDEKENNFASEVSDLSYDRRFRVSKYNRKNKITDFRKQLLFIDSPYFESLRIDVPVSLKITPRFIRGYNNSDKMYRMSNLIDLDLSKFSKFIQQRFKGISLQNKFYYHAVFALYIETISLLLDYNFTIHKDLRNYIKGCNEEIVNYESLKTEELFQELLVCLEKMITSKHWFIDINYLKKVEVLMSKLEFLNKLKNQKGGMALESSEEGARNRYTESFIFNYADKSGRFIIDHIELFEESSFKVNWLGISSGHKAYLNIFSLIYHEIKRVRKSNLLLCIDEGDLYLHPQWQIEFFDKLITVLPKIFKGNIQLLLTSHSPFLLSDLPKQNITVVSPNREEQTLNGNKLETETFAGNIYALYEEPFFLGNQRMSAFAKKKVDEIYREVEGYSKLKTEEKELLKRKIALIGDEVIKFHLMKRVADD